MKILGIGFIGAFLYSAGFVHGAVTYRRGTMRRLEKAQPLINKIVSDFTHEAVTKKMTKEEMETYLASELDFFTLVFK